MGKYFKLNSVVNTSDYVSSWQSKEISNESIKPPTTTNNSLTSESSSNFSDPTLKHCLFGPVTLNKNADIEKYKYSGYDIEFDRTSSFPFTGGGFGQNVLIYGADMSTSIHIDNKGKDILVDQHKD